MAKEWVIQPRNQKDLMAALLEARGVIDSTAFLQPDYRQLHDPMGLKNMVVLVKRLDTAIKNQEPIAIFGDYDHDGTPAAALLADGLGAAGAAVRLVIIPNRDDGYGLNRAAIDQCLKEQCRLLITVDCGITNKPEIDYAVSQGLDCVVIDHHLVQNNKFPDKAIVINPKQVGDDYPFKELCACGLAFKVLQALSGQTGRLKESELKWYLDLVAISTICDMVPLIGENRILAHYGLIVLRQTKRLGLRTLIQAAAIEPSTINSYTVGFVIGPRLNAAGRLATAGLAYQLLVAKESQTANQLAKELNSLNLRRQTELEQILYEAEAAITAKALHQNKIILVSGKDWNDGVVGLVASRLMDRYHRPVVVLADQEDDLTKGSARSIDGFHLVEVLQQCEPQLVKYGGHAKAAGLTLAKDQLDIFYDKLIELAESRLTEEALQPRLRIDASLEPDDLNLETVSRLGQLEPYGLGNPRPVLMLPAAEIVDQTVIGKTNQHLRLTVLASDGRAVEAIAFSMATRQGEVAIGQRVDIAGALEINEWRDRRRLQFKVVDWRPTAV